MPDTRPSNAPDDLSLDDGETATRQVENVEGVEGAGGGGLGGADAASALGGSARAPEGATPNSPIDVGVAAPDGGRGEEREAQLRSLDEGAKELDRT